ncbi:hypothetical protein [Paraburkholderia sp. BCC1885]|uniref:hypothetical protein n=1 Tax=Paraburkholderia sp. BCC1885 TaxID=2562669 RepID=UPI0011845718|nr:hypothetical protein [Paraburkholderia sp. BCC1885]
MNTREAQIEIGRLNSLGMSRSAIFSRLTGRGVRDSRLAWLVASHVDPRRRAGNQRHIRIVIAIALVQAVIGCLQAFGIGEQIVPGTGWVTGAVTLAVGLLFAWGFYRNQAGTYNAYLLMAMVQLPFQLDGFSAAPAGTTIGVATALGLLAYVWWVRTRVFPDFAFLSPRRIRGSYIFSE